MIVARYPSHIPSCLVAAAALVLTYSGPAGAEASLRLAELVKAVRERSPAIAGASDRRDAARIRISRVRALDDPFATVMTQDVPPALRGGMPMVRFQATQMLPWPGKRDRMAAVAERETEAAGARMDATILDAVTQAERLYHQLYLNAEARRINRDQRAIVDALVTIANGRLDSGVGSHHDVLKMQTEASMLDDNLIMLRADRTEMAAMLNALLDRPAAELIGEPVASWSPAIPAERGKLVSAALERRPELREMAAMGAAERAMAEVARRQYFPDVMVGGLYDVRIGGMDTLGAMVGLNLPIWIGSKQRLDVQGAETRARAVGRERAAMAAMMRAEIERQLARIDAAEQRIHLLEDEFIPRAQQTFDSALRSFPAGSGMSSLEVLDALRTVTNQRLQRVALAVDRELALVDLERATGIPAREVR